MNLTVTKELFLNAPSNKQRFIHLLAEKLKEKNCTVYHAKSNADLLIVKKAIESVESNQTV